MVQLGCVHRFWPGLLVILVAVGNAPPLTAQEPQGIHFHEDYNDAIREAKLTKKPIFLEFRCAP